MKTGKSASPILNENPKKSLQDFRTFLELEGIGNGKELANIAQVHMNYLSNVRENKIDIPPTQVLEQRWYASLANGAPDYSVYNSDYYLAELWACWVIYSRKYLLQIEKVNSLPPTGVKNDIHPRVIVDVGCGFGYTTAALKQLYPQATVYGTNIPHTVQWSIARRMSEKHHFKLVSDVKEIPDNADLVFASEYFEHFYNPIEHLLHICNTIHPKAWLIANTFTSPAIGHFNTYKTHKGLLSGKEVSRLFNNTLRDKGYTKIKTKLWNNRPAYWKM